MTYASDTKVPVSRSQVEVQTVLKKYGATGFAYGEQGPLNLVMFEMQGRRIKFILPMPIQRECPSQKFFEQKCRSQWRALVLAIKAKLQSVESGITTLEQEFMAHIVLPSGQTVGEVMIPQIELSYQNKKMPPLLGYAP